LGAGEKLKKKKNFAGAVASRGGEGGSENPTQRFVKRSYSLETGTREGGGGRRSKVGKSVASTNNWEEGGEGKKILFANLNGGRH